MRRIAALSLCFILLAIAGYSQDEEHVCLAPAQLTLSHHFGRGVGHKGYTSAELFFVRSNDSNVIPYVDGRFHVMDTGRFASNVGAGLRYLVMDDMLSIGGNFYYDFRDSDELNTHQIAPGIEILSPYVDFRVNGYIPVGGTKHSDPLKFNGFSGNQINVKRTSYYAFPSINAEVGVPTPMIPWMYTDFYVGIGPYYLFGATVSGNECRSSWGGKFRVVANITQYVGLEFELNHDRIFNTTYQGIVSVNIPLWKSSACRTGKQGYGKRAFRARTLRPVMRNEIIPVKKKSQVRPLKDGNGNIIRAIFVNNLVGCPGLGTFESPFCSFASVPSVPAIVYAFQGTGTPTLGYSNGFVMSTGQTLQGSGLPLTVNGIAIPSFTPGNPVLTNGVGPTITLASNTIVRGITIQGSGAGQSGVFGNNIANVTLEQNVVNNAALHGIEITNHAGGVYVAYNVVSSPGQNGISLDHATNPGSAVVLHNTISQSPSSGILIRLDHPQAKGLLAYNNLSRTVNPGGGFDIGTEITRGKVTISHNTMNSNPQFSIHALDGHHVISNNTIVNNFAGPSQGISYQTVVAGSPKQAYILNNQVTMSNTAPGILVQNLVGVFDIFTEIRGNAVSSDPAAGILIQSINPGVICSSITNNGAPTFILDGTVSPVRVKQSQERYTSSNVATTGFTEVGTVTFGSPCIPLP